jgi:hypothetical protein
MLPLLYCLTVGILLVSWFVPWRFNKGFRTPLLYLPYLAIVTYLAYEYTLPDDVNIRIDLLLLMPIGMVAFVLFFVRVFRINFLEQAANSERPQSPAPPDQLR